LKEEWDSKKENFIEKQLVPFLARHFHKKNSFFPFTFGFSSLSLFFLPFSTLLPVKGKHSDFTNSFTSPLSRGIPQLNEYGPSLIEWRKKKAQIIFFLSCTEDVHQDC